MEIVLHPTALRIQVESGSIEEVVIRDFAKRNFSSTLSSETSMVIFHRKESELSHRKTFLHWVYRSYCKTAAPDDTLKKRLLLTPQLPIKIRFIGKKELEQSVEIVLKVLNSTHLLLSHAPASARQVHGFIRYYFKEEASETTSPATFCLDLSTAAAKMKLKQLLHRKRILHYPLKLSYDARQIKRLLQSSSGATPLSDNRTLLLQDYALLQSKPSESFQTIRSRYKKLLFSYHPDRVFNESEAIIKRYTEQFQRIQEAFERVKKALESEGLSKAS